MCRTGFRRCPDPAGQGAARWRGLRRNRPARGHVPGLQFHVADVDRSGRQIALRQQVAGVASGKGAVDPEALLVGRERARSIARQQQGPAHPVEADREVVLRLRIVRMRLRQLSGDGETFGKGREAPPPCCRPAGEDPRRRSGSTIRPARFRARRPPIPPARGRSRGIPRKPRARGPGRRFAGERRRAASGWRTGRAAAPRSGPRRPAGGPSQRGFGGSDGVGRIAGRQISVGEVLQHHQAAVQQAPIVRRHRRQPVDGLPRGLQDPSDGVDPHADIVAQALRDCRRSARRPSPWRLRNCAARPRFSRSASARATSACTVRSRATLAAMPAPIASAANRPAATQPIVCTRLARRRDAAT